MGSQLGHEMFVAAAATVVHSAVVAAVVAEQELYVRSRRPDACECLVAQPALFPPSAMVPVVAAEFCC